MAIIVGAFTNDQIDQKSKTILKFYMCLFMNEAVVVSLYLKFVVSYCLYLVLRCLIQ